jgi:putative acetyltransferase
MKENFLIREIKKEDNEKIATIIRSVLKEFNAAKPGTVYFDPTTDDLFSLFQKSNSKYFIAEFESEIIGGAGVFPTPNLPESCCELVKLYLSQNFRGKGFGKTLIEKCFSSAKEFNYAKMYLETMPELSTAVGLYEKCDFKYLNKALGDSGHFGCAIWMMKTL